MLLFPPSLAVDQETPQEFALQFWDAQKLKNASLVVSIIGIMVGPILTELFWELTPSEESPRAHSSPDGTWHCFKRTYFTESASFTTTVRLQPDASLLPDHRPI
jgi:hypothetical protein